MSGCSLVCRFCGQQANKKSIEKHLAFLVKSSPVPYACLEPSIRCQKMDLTLFFSSPNLINLEYNRWAKWNNLLTVPTLTSLAASLPEHKHLTFCSPKFLYLCFFQLTECKVANSWSTTKPTSAVEGCARVLCKNFSSLACQEKK